MHHRYRRMRKKEYLISDGVLQPINFVHWFGSTCSDRNMRLGYSLFFGCFFVCFLQVRVNEIPQSQSYTLVEVMRIPQRQQDYSGQAQIQVRQEMLRQDVNTVSLPLSLLSQKAKNQNHKVKWKLGVLFQLFVKQLLGKADEHMGCLNKQES